jgi:hypothetical protein
MPTVNDSEQGVSGRANTLAAVEATEASGPLCFNLNWMDTVLALGCDSTESRGALGSEILNRLVDWFRLSYEGLLNEATVHRSWRKQPAVGVKTRQSTIKGPWPSILA